MTFRFFIFIFTKSSFTPPCRQMVSCNTLVAGWCWLMSSVFWLLSSCSQFGKCSYWLTKWLCRLMTSVCWLSISWYRLDACTQLDIKIHQITNVQVLINVKKVVMKNDAPPSWHKLDTGWQKVVTGLQKVDTGYWKVDTGCWQFDNGY